MLQQHPEVVIGFGRLLVDHGQQAIEPGDRLGIALLVEGDARPVVPEQRQGDPPAQLRLLGLAIEPDRLPE
jgi:hypothetical protein